MKYLKNKLLLYVSLLLIFSVLALTSISSIVYYNSSMSQSEIASGELVSAYKRAFNEVTDSYRNNIQSLASKRFLTDSTIPASQVQQELSEEAQRTGFDYLELADAQGNNTRGDKLSGQDFFEQAKSGESYIASPTLNSSEKLVLYVAAKIPGSTQILYGQFPYEALSDGLNQVKIGENGYVFAINADGHMILHPKDDSVAHPEDYFELAKTDDNYKPTAAIFKRMVNGETGTGYSFYNGERRLVGFMPLEGPEGWALAVTRPVTQVQKDIKNTLILCIAIGFILLLISIILTRIFSKKITDPIVEATVRIERLEAGDLKTEVAKVKGKDEIARLMQALDRTIQGLRTYIGDISDVLYSVSEKQLTTTSNVQYVGDFIPIQTALQRIVQSLNLTLHSISHATAQVRTGAEQVALGGQSLAENSSNQAATTDRLLQSLGMVSTHIQQTVDNSLSMQSRSQNALLETEQGNQEMDKMLASMKSIDDYSKKIQSIIHMIDDISFQTNILALNAAVEAARAGAAGKGFAVVADEVRQLASKSADAAKKTSELIENTILSVGDGMENAQNAANAFQRIVEQTNDISSLVDKVTESLNSQSHAVIELNSGVQQISDVTQSNSAAAQESAATGEELLSQMQMLEQMVSEFKTMPE